MPTRRRLLPPLGAALPAFFVAAPVAFLGGWWVTDHLEQDDRFCVSCHLTADVVLHRDNFDDFGARPPVSLAVAHAAAGNERRSDAAFHCIDCHGGTGLLGRARVKLLSAKDAFWYAVGRFEEPEGMRWPLLDSDCSQCHETFDEKLDGEVRRPARDPRFHELAVHNTKLGVACVECHVSHEHGGLPDHDFLHAALVRSRCAQCHPEYEEE